MIIEGLPRWLSGKESAWSTGVIGSIPESGKAPGEGNGNPVFLPGKSHDQRTLVGYSPSDIKRGGWDLAI